MDLDSLCRLLRGSFNFLRVEPEELRRVVPGGERILPMPQRIFLEREEATPLIGFPVLLSPGIRELREALQGYLRQEEALEVATLRQGVPDRRAHDAAWRVYRRLLERATENATRSSFGRQYPSIFWLYHSIAVSRLFKELPRRLVRLDAPLAREQGEQIKYRIFGRFLDRILALTYDVVHRVAEEAEEAEKDLFPRLLERMRDNVLILTEDHIGPDLAELDAYFRGALGGDGRQFRERLAITENWHAHQLAADPELRAMAVHLLGAGADEPAAELFKRPGYLPFLASRRGYRADRLLAGDQVVIWERLLPKLKEFELLVALRRMVVPVRGREDGLVCQAPNPRGTGLLPREVRLSSSTRPLDYMTPWVVDPVVERFGLIYDITDFSAIVSVLRRSGREEQDASFRRIFRFQRWVNELARRHRLKLEKYLGDGALYSGRHPDRLLAVAVRLQQYYRRALQEGFPFDRGLRIALNYGSYRLLPIEEGAAGLGQRYEFFGHGIVELSRLVTGKAMREIEELKNLLVTQGYAAAEVDRFFAPAFSRDLDLVDKREEARGFYSYINPSGTLVNEGIVATRSFIEQLDAGGTIQALYAATVGERAYVAFHLQEGKEELAVGIRKLGQARLKGLGRLAVYEVVDGSGWPAAAVTPLTGASALLPALERPAAGRLESAG